uniref:Transmembrane p24 trafficking protein 1a n=1 Tax=Oryzias latipes TaxID=8090 RepID=A0A3P9HVS1_ORYLA
MMAVTAQICLEMLLTLTMGLILGSEAKQHMEFTFILPAGSTECFFQSTTRNDSMEVEYQVIAGSGLDVGFALISPNGHRLISDFRNSHGIHMVDPAEDGDYRLCFDNSFSKLSEKMVFFEVVVNSQNNAAGGREDWENFAVTESTVDYRLEDIRSSMESVQRHLEKSRQVQAVLRAFESRDRYLLEDNLWRVSFWSCINLLVLLTVAVVQIYTLQRLFDNKRVCT